MKFQKQLKGKTSKKFGAVLWKHRQLTSKQLKNLLLQNKKLKTKKLSNFGTQLMAKQLVASLYGNLKLQQFKNLLKQSEKYKGKITHVFFSLLEKRLDNVVYRMGFGSTRAEARQMVSHKAFMVNGKVVNIPSYQVQPGDEIEVRESKRGHLRIAAALKIAATREECDWLEVDEKNFKGVFKSVPDRTDLSTEINENLIVELYSK